MASKIVFLDSATVGQVENLELLPSLGEFNEYQLTLPEQRIERIADNEIVITNKVIIDKEIIDSCPSLKLICIAATGTNNVDLEYAKLKGIQVKNVAGYSTESVAQSAFSMLFHLLHQNTYFDNYVKDGEYQKSPIFTHHGRKFWELKGKFFGIIGLGTIGKRVAEIANVFGATVIYHSTSGKNLANEYKHHALKELLSLADIVSIHCPLNEKTLNLINIEELKLMKSTAYLLNLGRGGIVNESALVEALDSNLIAGAAIDVLTKEPITAENPLLTTKRSQNLFVTPHIAWASIESRSLLIEKIIENIKLYQSSSNQ